MGCIPFHGECLWEDWDVSQELRDTAVSGNPALGDSNEAGAEGFAEIPRSVRGGGEMERYPKLLLEVRGEHLTH